MEIIYLDNNATTKPNPDVVTEIYKYLNEIWGNPSSIHLMGKKAKEGLEWARSEVAKLIGANPEEVVFTSGGTEANNQALKGVVSANEKKGKHIITSKIEHPAVLQTAKYLEKKGCQVTYIGVDDFGTIDLEELDRSIRKDTILISIMMANNEVGIIEPIKKIADIANKHNIIFHTDAVQALGKIPFNVKDLGINLATISSHKIHGPKGVGALYIKKGTLIESLLHGGHQEKNKRTGTENIPGIVGFGKAAGIAKK